MSEAEFDPVFGQLDASYQAAGAETGLRKLCTEFYALMASLPEARVIHEMHHDELETRIDKLTLFLSLWLGGPRTYTERYRSANMMAAHQHLAIAESERDAWLLCMHRAIDVQDYSPAFKVYFKEQIKVPAQRIMRYVQSMRD